MFRKLYITSITFLAIALLSLTGCGGGGNSDAKTGLTAPTVTAKSPVGSSVSINAVITATFSAPMNASSITTSSFTLKDSANNNIAGTVSYSSTSNTATFTPSANLASLTSYTATISTTVQNANGIPLASSESWTFSTPVAPDTTPPAVLSASLSPAINATGVVANSTISVTFSKLLNLTTLNATTFTLSNGSSAITGVVTSSTTTVLGAQVTTATFTPSSALAAGKTLTATITTGVKDLAGNALVANYTWSFTTEFIFNKTISSNVTNYNLNNDAIANGWDGTSVLNATVTISPGVYVYSTNTANAGFDTGALSAGSKVTIINNGYIMGMGGMGGGYNEVGLAGGNAMSLAINVTIDTSNGYILGGGGGGGGGGGNFVRTAGGGGAGGGQGGSNNTVIGGLGGSVGLSGVDGARPASGYNGVAGGGGGRVVPSSTRVGDTGFANFGYEGRGNSGGGTGSVGGAGKQGDGGGIGVIGGNGQFGFSGGGGGGYGAAGGAGYGDTTNIGGAGGKSIALNGNSVTWVNAHTNVYGAIQ